MKKLLAALMCTALMLALLPLAAYAADGDITYIDENGVTQTTEGLTVTPITAGTASLTNGWYVVNSDVTRNGTITVSGNVHLILMDGFTLSVTGSTDNAGMRVSPGNSLTVYGQVAGTGAVTAQGGSNGAGIGGGYNQAGGTININSGTVTANGNGRGAGIGGGMLGSSGTISIAGGTVNATSGDVTAAAGAAGIGGGYGNGVTKITISGGTVIATALDRGAGIGGGSYGSGGIIEISGGSVTATNSSHGAGIGGGDEGNGGSITISGGTVAATSGYGGAGIGGGYSAHSGIINIHGGHITAYGGSWGAGIGGGGGAGAKTINITNGVINAYAGDYNTGEGSGGAGIGSGGSSVAGSHSGGTVNILGGVVTATGSYSSLDIGRARNGINGTVLIDDAARVTLAAKGIEPSVTTLRTCILQGLPAGSLRGAYEDGEKIDGTLIDVSNPTLSNGAGYTVSGNTVTLTGSGNSYVLFGSTTSRNVVVSSGSTADVALFTADIQPASGCAFNMTGATVNMRLVGSNTLTSTSDFAGIQALAGSTLTISGATTATLTTQGGENCAGIGGIYENAGGTITINSGTVTATGGSKGAGIGGGYYYSSGGTITINGGTVAASGGKGASGIGGGDRGSGDSITINGGTVYAWGGAASSQSGAGIGGGVYGNGGSITINGGTVNAWGAGDGAGIGGGQSGSGGNITISSGTVAAQGGSKGAGIGGGWSSYAGNIIISGGTVTAWGGYQGSGIGCGSGGAGGSVAISGGTIMAYGGSKGYGSGGGAGIGGGGTDGNGNGGANGTVTISGSATVTARGSDGGAGIGGGGAGIGGGGAGGTINIIGGNVTALGRHNGVGIGGGKGGAGGGAGGTVLADGENTTVSATGDGYGYDIGSGHSNSAGGSLSIQNNATVNLNRNGTNANDNFVTGTIGGGGAGFLAGTYLNSQKLLACSSVTASPSSGAKAFDNVTLTASVTGLFIPDPQGQIAFFDNGSKIGQASLTRTADGSADATAAFVWSSRGGSHTITAQYVQDETADSYYMTDDGELGGYLVAKIEQAPLSISGILDTVTYGDASFTLSVNGGSGTGTGLSYSVTEGEAVSVSASGVVTVEKAGQATITVTKAGDTNYLPVSADVTITVNKAIPQMVVFPSAGTITYGQELSDSMLMGGSGDGTFAWEDSHTIPTVINSGYNVVFTPNDTDNYDYTGVELTKNVSITVNKATPVVSFPMADEITYEQPLSDSSLTGGSGDGSFAWESPSTIPTVVNSGYRVVFTPDDTDNYKVISQIITISVQKAEQATLTIGGVPSAITYGDSSFDLSGSGGSGTGTFSYLVASGDAVSVSTSGTVTVREAGTAQITATKAGDDNYLPVSVDVTITVNKAIPPTVIFPSAGELTYGQRLSDSALTGGSAEGTFAWENPDTVPTVINIGYNVIFTPNDTDNYDYTGFVLSQDVSIHVNKAIPAVTFPTAEEITYEQPLSNSELTGGSGDGSFAWESPATIPTVVNSGYRVVYTPDDTDNYNSLSQLVPISVLKAEQEALSIVIPSVTYGDAPFGLTVNGGSGTGTALSFSVTSGDAVSVSTSGTVTVLKAETAQITVIKAGDSNYLPVSTDVTITVDKAIPTTVFPNTSWLTYGQQLSDSVLTGGSGAGSFAWESADTVPTVVNSGYNVAFTPSDTDNYLMITKPVGIVVRKAAQAPLTISGIPETLIYGDAPFELIVGGGSGTGPLTYTVTTGNAVTVDSSGKVTIAHGGISTIKVTNTGDDNYLPVSRTVSFTVNKAAQTTALSFSLPESIAYGDTPFQIVGSGGDGSGAISYQVNSGNAVAVSTTGDVTVLRPGEAVITAVKTGDSDYLSQEKTIQISVGKGTQSALVITDIPIRITSGSAPFGLIVSGGSGTGIVSYAVTSGRAVSVDTGGKVTILRPGTAVLTVTKAEDDLYLATTATVELNVRRAASTEDISATSAASPMPSAAPSSTVAPTTTAMPRPTATDASPSQTKSPAPVTLKPLSIQADESTDIIIATISIDDLPEGTTSIKLPSGEIFKIDKTQKTLELPISQKDLNESGELVLIALDRENVPLGNYQIELTKEALQEYTPENGSDFSFVLYWIAAGFLVIGMATAVTVIWNKKRK